MDITTNVHTLTATETAEKCKKGRKLRNVCQQFDSQFPLTLHVGDQMTHKSAKDEASQEDANESGGHAEDTEQEITDGQIE